MKASYLLKLMVALQEDAMVSSKEVAEKYKSFKDYEDDFM